MVCFSVSVFCVLLLQIILFAIAHPSASHEENCKASVVQPGKHCLTSQYLVESINFSTYTCFDNPSEKLDAKLKCCGDVNLGYAKGTFDTEVSISFNQGKRLNGTHHYYMKGNELWVRHSTHSNMLSKSRTDGDFRLCSLPFIGHTEL